MQIIQTSYDKIKYFTGATVTSSASTLTPNGTVVDLRVNKGYAGDSDGLIKISLKNSRGQFIRDANTNRLKSLLVSQVKSVDPSIVIQIRLSGAGTPVQVIPSSNYLIQISLPSDYQEFPLTAIMTLAGKIQQGNTDYHWELPKISSEVEGFAGWPFSYRRNMSVTDSSDYGYLQGIFSGSIKIDAG